MERERLEKEKKKKKKKTLDFAHLQAFAADIFCRMADFVEFEPYLCSPAVLNFLCIALNSVQECEELVCRIFEKLARRPDNLVVLMEGSVRIPVEQS